jgi:serine/threonine protein kinase
MAPEVALSEPYGLSADLYSFSILLWEILTLEKAFGRLTVDEHKERAVLGSERPSLVTVDDDDDMMSNGLKDILQSCWVRDPMQRLDAATVHRLLKEEVQDLVARDFPVQAQAEEGRKR